MSVIGQVINREMHEMILFHMKLIKRSSKARFSRDNFVSCDYNETALSNRGIHEKINPDRQNVSYKIRCHAGRVQEHIFSLTQFGIL